MKKIFLFVITAIIFLPTVTFAQRYLVDLPIATQGNFNEYINLLYKMSISIAALLAVVKIVIAGAKYMLTDVVNTKGDAKKDIQGALLGLLLIMGAVIVLNTINPALTDGGLKITQLPRVPLNITGPAPVAVPPAGSTANPATTPTSGAAAAANSAATQGSSAATQTTSSCGSKDASNSTYTITVVTVSGCSSAPIGTALIANLRKSCVGTGADMAYVGNPIVSAACAIPKTLATQIGIQTSGTVIRKAGSYVVTLRNTLDKVSLASLEKGKCEDPPIFGLGKISSDWLTVTCTHPTVIQYSGNALIYARSECSNLNGTYDSPYCIIK